VLVNSAGGGQGQDGVDGSFQRAGVALYLSEDQAALQGRKQRDSERLASAMTMSRQVLSSSTVARSA
jgi:hypothetical protein